MGRRKAKKGSISASICRAARAILNLTQEELAERVGVSSSTLRRFEGGIPMNQENDAKLIAFLKQEGMVFLYRNDDVVGLLHGDIEDIVFDY